MGCYYRICRQGQQNYFEIRPTVSEKVLLAVAKLPEFLSEHQIREGIEDNSKIFFLFLYENICCWPS